MNIDFQVMNLNQSLNFTTVVLTHAALRLRGAAPQSRQSPDGSFLKNTKRAVKEQINLLLHRSFYIFRRMARCFTQKKSRNVLSSQAVAHQVLSALEDFTSVFGMGTGVALPPSLRN